MSLSQVVQRSTDKGRSYKVYFGPDGEYTESKRQARRAARPAVVPSSTAASFRAPLQSRRPAAIPMTTHRSLSLPGPLLSHTRA